MTGPSADASSGHRPGWKILRGLSIGAPASSPSPGSSGACSPGAPDDPMAAASSPRTMPRRVLGRHSTSEEPMRPLAASAPMPAFLPPADTAENPPGYDDLEQLAPHHPHQAGSHNDAFESSGPPRFEQVQPTQRERRASEPDLEPMDRPSYLSNLASVVDQDVGFDEELPSYSQDRFVHEGTVKLHVTTHGRFRPEVVVLDKQGKIVFKPEVHHSPSQTTRRWALHALPITTVIKDEAGLPLLFLVQGPRVMDFTARSPLSNGLVFRLASNDLFNPGAHVRFARNQRYVCLDVRRSIQGRWSIRAHPSGRIVGLVDKEAGLRRNLRVTVAPGESSLLITAVALAMREPCYYDSRLPGPLMSYY